MTDRTTELKHAVAAILVLEDGRYLMQLRDQKPGIYFPGHWGLFGGAIDANETAEAALRRELREEIGIEVGRPRYFSRISFDFTYRGSIVADRYYYEAMISAAEHGAIRLGEGADVKAFVGKDILNGMRVTPYDAMAIWMHMTRGEQEATAYPTP